MRAFTAALVPLALSLFAHDALADELGDYLNSVCSPNATTAEVPPCISIGNIEQSCEPNGTSPLAFEAHAQCMCGGSYFAEWVGCRECLFDHGGLSERNLSYYKSVMTTASNELCTGTPTAKLADLFSSAEANVPIPTTGGTVLSDISSGDSAISLYYTATGSSGPGKITGSATAATATATSAAAGGSTNQGTGATGGTKTSAPTTATTGTSSTTSKSSNAAVPTGAVGGQFLFAVAGGALMAVL